MQSLFNGHLDQVLRHAAAAADAHAQGVRQALDLVVAAQDVGARENAAQALRIALVAQSVGHEAMAANGSTGKARREHALAALAAWDQP